MLLSGRARKGLYGKRGGCQQGEGISKKVVVQIGSMGVVEVVEVGSRV
jgi:hypothetical protein